MLRSDILEGLDYSLRMNGGNPNKIFGGKQLILVGDIFQLPQLLTMQMKLKVNFSKSSMTANTSSIAWHINN